MKYSDSGIAPARAAPRTSRAFRADQRIRVVSVGQEQEAQLAAFAHLAQRILQRAPRRGSAGAIAVEAEDQLVADRKTRDRCSGVVAGAERRDGVRDASLMKANDVHVAFNDEQASQGSRRLARFVQTVQLAALVEELGLRRVQVFRLALVEHASAEADRAAARIAIGNMTRSRKRS
jgi:hypothetical protein